MRWPAIGNRTRVIAAGLAVCILLLGVLASVATGSAVWLVVTLQVVVVELLIVLSRSQYNMERARQQPASNTIQYLPGEPLDMLRRDIQRDVSALLAMHRLVKVDGSVPAPGGWAATPETLLLLVARITSAESISTIVECGSGTSTIWMALALRRRGTGKLISLEHDPAYARATQRALDSLHLTEFVEIRQFPLVAQSIGGVEYQWFDPASSEPIENISLLFVDGPPGYVGKHARFPAVPVLADKLTNDAWIVLDDVDRTDEQEVQELWTSSDWSGVRFEAIQSTDRASILGVLGFPS